MKRYMLIAGVCVSIATPTAATCPPLPGPFTQGNVCPYSDQSKCFTADNANAMVQAIDGVCADVTGLQSTSVRASGDIGGTPAAPLVVNVHLAAPLSGSQGGLGAAQPTCASGEHLTCNGTACSCAGRTPGSISIATSPRPTSLALDSDGTLDWITWNNATTEIGYGFSGYPRKALGGGRIADLGFIGNGNKFASQSSGTTVTWTAADSIKNTAGSLSYQTGTYGGTGNGFRLMVPADTFPRTLKIYGGLWKAQANLTCRLSDGSSPDVVNLQGNDAGTTGLVYTITYSASRDGQWMYVNLTIANDYSGNNTGNVTMIAATLR